MHRLSLPHRVSRLTPAKAALCSVVWVAAMGPCGAQPAEQSREWPQSWPQSAPRLAALGLTANAGAVHPGVDEQRVSPGVAWVFRWGRFRLSNGGPLASRTADATERGLATDLALRGSFRLSATVGREQGRQSSDVAALRGVHDVSPFWRGTVRAAWQFAPTWEAAAAWTTELWPRRGGERLSLTIARDWPIPEPWQPWSLTTGVAATWRNATSADRAYGITTEDAARTPYPVTTLGAGWTEAGAFATARRPLDQHWLIYGSVASTGLLGAAALAPWVEREHTVNLRLGVGRRF